MSEYVKENDIVQVVAGPYDGANGIVIEIQGDKALVSLRGYTEEKEIPTRFLKRFNR